MAISTKAAKKFAENCVPQSFNLFTFEFPHHASADATPVVALECISRFLRRFQIVGIFAVMSPLF